MSPTYASATAPRPPHLIVARIRSKWPDTPIILRADSGFARQRIMEWCEQREVNFVLGLARNSRLESRLEDRMEQARQRFKKTDSRAKLYDDFDYSTLDRWSSQRCVIAKAAYSAAGSNPRLVTDRP